MEGSALRPYIVIGQLIAVLLVITACAGVFNPDLYRPFLNDTLVTFQFFQDLVSLLFAPLLIVVMVLAQRGSRRAFVIWAGILVYVTYYYAFYAFGFVYTVYYPLYLALIGLGAFSLIGLLASTDRAQFQAHMDPRMAVRLMSGVLGMTVLFVPIWLSMVFEGIRTQTTHETDLVFVLDLPFLIPACLFAAVQLWRRRPIGYLLAGPLLFKAVISGILLSGGELLKVRIGLAPALDQLSMYLFLAIMGLLAFVLFLRAVDDEPGNGVKRTKMGPLILEDLK